MARRQIRDTGLGFGVVTILLHWLGAALFIAYIALDLLGVGRGEARVMRVHLALGLAIFILFAFRLFWRLGHYHPLPLGAVSPIAVIAARGVALGLLLAGIVLPLLEWVGIWSSGGAVAFFEVFVLPAPFAPDATVARVAVVLRWLGIGAATLGFLFHAFGAFKHHFILKDDTLRRMLGKHVAL